MSRSPARKAPVADVPGLSYYAPEPAAPVRPGERSLPADRALAAIEQMFGYYA